MPTLSEVQTLLSASVGAGLSFTTELNLVRARLLQGGSWKGAKELAVLDIHTDADGSSIVTLPRKYETILAGAVKNANVLCSGVPLGVRDGFAEFSPNGLGYGGLTRDFTEVNGRFAVFQEWTAPRYLRFKFETNETTGVIHLIGKLSGSDVFSQYSGSWIKGEKVAFTATTAMSVSGGTQDGIYTDRGVYNSAKHWFEILGGTATDPADGQFSVAWVTGDNKWYFYNENGDAIYYSSSSVATPDLATNWKNASDDSAASITVLPGVAQVTSSSKFDAVGLSAVKPSTNGRVSVFAVDDDDAETAAAIWEPDETVPRLHRYKIPDCSTSTNKYLALAKLAYVAVANSDDEVVPGNIAALEKGLEARKAERAQDLARAGQLWSEAQALLAQESENDEGGAQAHVQVADDFAMSHVSGRGWGGFGYWPWNGYGG